MSIQHGLSEDGRHTVSDIKAQASTTLDTLKDQAAQAADSAQGTLNSVASEARNRVNDIVEGQKQAGADQLAGVARAAKTAAGDLQQSNPQIARFVEGAAHSVDRFADDLRNRDVGDVLGSLTTFARQQPVAFFAGSVLAGVILARFLKSDPRPIEGWSETAPASSDDLGVAEKIHE